MGVPYVGSAPSGPNDIVTKSYQDAAISTAVAAIPVPTTTTVSYDAVAARGLAYEKVPLDWAKANGVKILFGEVGIPSTLDGSKYNANYNNALRVWMERAKAANAPFQIWSGGEWTLDLRAYGPAGSATSGDLAQATNVAGVLEPYLGYNTLNGVNLSGGEFGQNGQTLPTVPGVHGTDYQYPSANSIAYLGSRGIKTIRVPFRWERLQRTIGGALDTTESARFKAILDAAQANGMTVIADMHNYGGYTVATGQTAVLLGAAAPTNGNNITTMNDAFVDFWKKFAQAWGTHPGLNGYGLMNEPHDLTTTGDLGGSIWRTASAAASEALYDITGLNKNIFVSGFFYATSSDWVTQNGNTPWLYSFRDGYSLSTHPNVYFEAHMYFDDPDGGIYNVSYANNLTRATNAGFTSGTTQVQPEFVDTRARTTGAANQTAIAANTTAIASKANTVHTHVASDISDSTATGQALVKSADAASARNVIGAATPPLLLAAGTTVVPAGTPAGTIVGFRA